MPRPVDSTLHGVVDYTAGRGDFHGNVEAVRQANMEDPHRKIYDGEPALTPAVA